MDHALLSELFASARRYHGALARYAATLRAGGDIESPAQELVGAGLRYRSAIDRLLERGEAAREIVAIGSRLTRLRSTLASTSRQYNIIKRGFRM